MLVVGNRRIPDKVMVAVMSVCLVFKNTHKKCVSKKDLMREVAALQREHTFDVARDFLASLMAKRKGVGTEGWQAWENTNRMRMTKTRENRSMEGSYIIIKGA